MRLIYSYRYFYLVLMLYSLTVVGVLSLSRPLVKEERKVLGLLSRASDHLLASLCLQTLALLSRALYHRLATLSFQTLAQLSRAFSHLLPGAALAHLLSPTHYPQLPPLRRSRAPPTAQSFPSACKPSRCSRAPSTTSSPPSASTSPLLSRAS